MISDKELPDDLKAFCEWFERGPHGTLTEDEIAKLRHVKYIYEDVLCLFGLFANTYLRVSNREYRDDAIILTARYMIEMLIDDPLRPPIKSRKVS